MKVVLIGDVVGHCGRKILKNYLLKNKHKYDLVVVNGENAAGGFGLTGDIADEILGYGVDIITSGNHIWDKKEFYGYLSKSEKVLRPANYKNEAPGNGYSFVTAKNGQKVCVISLQGRVFMNLIDDPFAKIKEIINIVKNETKYIIIDFHAEATAEKLALGWFLDGKISLLVGTHTHVQTSDNKIFPEGMGYITDLGMTGASNSILGMSVNTVLPRFIDGLPSRFEADEGSAFINGIEAELDENGNCIYIERINKSAIEVELS